MFYFTMENLKLFYWIVSIILTFIWYYVYIKDIFYGKNKPHFFSWLIWWLITIVIYLLQLQDNPWAGAWVALFSWIISLIIAIISIFKWTKDINFKDKISLFLALFAIWIWIFIPSSSIVSCIILVLIDIFGYYPTFRKSYKNPFEENYILYFLSIFKFWIAILALNTITIKTSLYLIANFIILFFLVFMIIYRRKLLGNC